LYDASGFRKVFVATLFSDRAVATQDWKLYQLFIDGEYWGAYNAIERYDANYIASHYGVSPDNVILLRDGTESVEGEVGSTWTELYSFATNNDLSNAANYAQICKMMDMQSYIDWLCSIIYTCDMDTSSRKNSFMWRTIEANYESPYADGKWRWMSYDNDMSTGVEDYAAYDIDSFAQVGPYLINNPLDSLFVALHENESFNEQFVLSFMDMANYNFAPERVAILAADAVRTYGTALVPSAVRWGLPDNITASVNEINNFFENRFDYITAGMKKHWHLSGSLVNVNLMTSGTGSGVVSLNTITDVLENGEWAGKYFTDYPIALSAEPNQESSFDHWELDGKYFSSSKNIIVNLSEDCSIIAVYNRSKAAK